MEKWAPGITAIQYDDLGNSPAAVDRETGVVYVNPRFKGKVDKESWEFFLLHEMGHMVLKTRDEKKADKWAHEQYIKNGGSLKKSVFALTDFLNFNKPEDFERVQLQLLRAQKADGKKENFTGETMYTKSFKYYGGSKCDPDYSTYFTGTSPLSNKFDRSKALFFDAQGAAAGAAVGTVIPGIGNVVGGAIGGFASDIGNLFGGKPEDKSTTGYQKFLLNRPVLLFYPTLAEMIQASANWEPHIRQAIAKGYNAQNGTWDYAYDDFKGVVVNTSPIQAYMFKGASEKYPLNSTLNAANPVKTAAANAFSSVTNSITGGNQTILWVGIAVVVVALAIGGFFLFRK